MAKYIPVLAALALIVTPTVSFGQDTGKMKGPPNADGYKHSDGAGQKADQGANGSKGNNGAGAATSTGEDKK